MGYLLDTQVVVWLSNEPAKVPETVRDILREFDGIVGVSVASAWEYGQKRKLRPHDLPHDFESLIEAVPVVRMDFSFELHRYAEMLPLIHRDPFDRMLIAQAMHHDLTLVTSDQVIGRYPVKTLW